MGRSPCCEKSHTNKGAWSKEEDQCLIDYIRIHGEGCWRSLPKSAGLLRCGKSCRLRWINYLRPDLKRGNFTNEEDELIIKLQSLLGNKWSLIAARLPGRTDNEIKNYWNTHIKRKLISRGIDPQTHLPINQRENGIIPTARNYCLDIKKVSRSQVLSDSNIKLNRFKNVNPSTPLFLKPKTESIKVANCCTSSGTTTEEEQHQKVREMYQREPNLDLSIGLGGFQSESVQSLSVKSSEKWKPKQSRSYQSPIVSQTGLCLCCQLGCQNSKLCRNCLMITNGFYRFQSPLNS